MGTPTKTTIKKGQTTSLTFFINGSTFPVTAKFMGQARIFGDLKAYVFKNVSNDKMYELTIKQLSIMQGQLVDEDDVTF